MVSIDPATLDALSAYPPLILALIVVLLALGYMLRITSKERLDMEASRREERLERDRHHQAFISQQNDYNRDAGTRQAQVMGAALGELAQAFRELGANINTGMRDMSKEMRSMHSDVNSIRNELGRDVQALASLLKNEGEHGEEL